MVGRISAPYLPHATYHLLPRWDCAALVPPYRFRTEHSTVIEVEGLQKKYGDLVAVDGVSLTAEPGKIFGLLGPNGAGKTTTIGCISGLLQPTAGRIRGTAFRPRVGRVRPIQGVLRSFTDDDD